LSLVVLQFVFDVTELRVELILLGFFGVSEREISAAGCWLRGHGRAATHGLVKGVPDVSWRCQAEVVK
jgi:hypothetical protein